MTSSRNLVYFADHPVWQEFIDLVYEIWVPFQAAQWYPSMTTATLPWKEV